MNPGSTGSAPWSGFCGGTAFSWSLISCLNCSFYDPSKNNQCSEPQAEWVRDKEAANYCDYYRPNPGVRAGSRGPSKADDAKKKFDSLFRA